MDATQIMTHFDDSWVTSVRRRPGMYLGNTDTPMAAEHVVDELLSNTLDQYMAGRASWVRVRLDGPMIEVEDDGPGLPMAPDERGIPWGTRIFLEHHTTPSAFHHAPHVHVHGLHGVGVAVLCAASDVLRCQSWVDGALIEQVFEHGRLVRGPEVIQRGEGRGTRIRLRMAEGVFAHPVPRRARIRHRLFETAHLFPGVRAYLDQQAFYAPRGLADFAELIDAPTSPGLHEWGARPTYRFSHRDERLIVEATALGFGEQTQWRTWVNGRLTPLHGMHRGAFERALEGVGWQPNTAMIHVIAADTRFANPCRDELTDARCEGLDALLIDSLVRYRDAHLGTSGARSAST